MPEIIIIPPIIQTLSRVYTIVMGAFVAAYFLCKFANKKLTVLHVLTFIAVAVLQEWTFSLFPASNAAIWVSFFIYFLWHCFFCIFILKKSFSFSTTAGMIMLIITALFTDITGLSAYFQGYFFMRFNVLYVIIISISPIYMILEFFILRFIAKKYRVIEKNLAEKYLYILMIPCALYTLLLTQDFFDTLAAIYSMPDNGVNYAVITKAAIVLSTAIIGLFVTLSAFQKLCNYSNEEVEKAVLLEQVKSQKSYIEESKRRYEENRSLQHDLKNHLLVLSGLISEGKADEAQAYLDKLKSVADESALQINSGNLVVDILLSEKISHAIRSGISVSRKVHIPPNCAIDDFDLCVIFSNALDNALAACEAVSGNPHIEVNTGEKNRFFLIEFLNSCVSGTTIHEGTGLRNIRKIAEKYGGTLDIEIKNQAVNVSILLCLN